jgi:hypothetical protein
MDQSKTVTATFSGADPFVGARATTLSGDDNISDGVQIDTVNATVTTSTVDGLHYTVAANGTVLAMSRAGNRLSLDPQPQPFSTWRALNAYMYSAGSTGAFLVMGQENANPADISIRVSTWAGDGAVTGGQLAGVWTMEWVVNNNLGGQPGVPFSEARETWVVSDLGGGRIRVQANSYSFQATLKGNVLEPDGPWSAATVHQSLVTDGQSIAMAMIGVEPANATDVSARIGLATRSFTQADLGGTWYFQLFGDNPAGNDPGWSSGSFTVDATGAVIGGTGVNSWGETETITGGTLTIDSAGHVTGFFAFPAGGTASLPHGKLDASKTVLTMVVSGPDSHGLMVALKAGGTFTQADLAGTWYSMTFGDDPLGNHPEWITGTVIVDTAGVVTAAKSIESTGHVGTCIGGALTIDSAGQVSGSMTCPDSGTSSLHGKLDASKTILTLVNSNTY